MKRDNKRKVMIKMNESYSGKINNINLSFGTYRFIENKKAGIIQEQKSIIKQLTVVILSMAIVILGFALACSINNTDIKDYIIPEGTCIWVLVLSGIVNISIYANLCYKEEAYDIAMKTQYMEFDNDGYVTKFHFMSNTYFDSVEFKDYLFDIFLLIAQDIAGIKTTDDINQFLADHDKDDKDLYTYITKDLNIINIYKIEKE